MGTYHCRNEPQHFLYTKQIQIMCRKDSYINCMKEKNKSIIKIELVPNKEDKIQRFLDNSSSQSKTKQKHRSTILSELEQNGMALLTPSTFQTQLSRTLHKTLTSQQPPISIIIQQPICTNKVNLSKVFQQVVMAILTTNSDLQQKSQTQKQSKIKSTMKESGREKIRVVVYWARLNEESMLAILEKINLEVNRNFQILKKSGQIRTQSN